MLRIHNRIKAVFPITLLKIQSDMFPVVVMSASGSRAQFGEDASLLVAVEDPISQSVQIVDAFLT